VEWSLGWGGVQDNLEWILVLRPDRVRAGMKCSLTKSIPYVHLRAAVTIADEANNEGLSPRYHAVRNHCASPQPQ
jgi:hypothetical protein